MGQTLADLGADVIKDEAPGGDDTRRHGPPFIETAGDRFTAYFHATNRACPLDTVAVRQPKGQAQVRGRAKYGLDHASLAAINPRLIYCSITGFGQMAPVRTAWAMTASFRA